MAAPSESSPLNPSEDASPSFKSRLDRFFHPKAGPIPGFGPAYARFSADALKNLPERGAGSRVKSKRADHGPSQSRNFVRDYNAINQPGVKVRVPKSVPTPVKVESKVWFANERTYISYLSMGLLLSTIASGLLFGARDSPARWFALAYAGISAGILVYGWAIFQKRLTLISTRNPDGFDNMWGPMFICAALFIAILANFVFRLQQAHEKTGVNPMSLQYAWSQASLKVGA